MQVTARPGRRPLLPPFMGKRGHPLWPGPGWQGAHVPYSVLGQLNGEARGDQVEREDGEAQASSEGEAAESQPPPLEGRATVHVLEN